MNKPDYTNSILNVSTSFLEHYKIKSEYAVIPCLQEELQKNYNHIIYILLDGMGVSTVKHHLQKEDALRKYMKKEITSVFPPTTVAATNAVLSGKAPISNGYLGWVQYFKEEDSNTVVFMNTDFDTKKGHKENVKEKYLAYQSILEQIKKKNPDVQTNRFFPDFMEGGSASFQEEIEKVLITTHNSDQSFNYLYWTEPDLSSHKYGCHSTELHQIMTNLNYDFEDLIQNILEDTLVVVIADHGLTDIKEIPFFANKELNDMLLRTPSIEPRAANFFVKEGQVEDFEKAFNKAYSSYYKLYSKEDFLKSKLLGPSKKHPLIDDFLGDYIAVAISDHMFIFTESKGHIAHHAGLSSDELMVPLILYSHSIK